MTKPPGMSANCWRALRDIDMPVIFTLPNADTNGRLVAKMIDDYVARHAECLSGR